MFQLLTLVLKLRDLPQGWVLVWVFIVRILHEWIVGIRIDYFRTHILHCFAAIIFAPVYTRGVLHDV